MAGMDLVRELGVSGVPTVVLDGRLRLDNPSPDESLLDFVLHAADPSRPAPGGHCVSPVPGLRMARLTEQHREAGTPSGSR